MSYQYGEYYPRDYWRMESEFMHMYPRAYHDIYPVVSGVIEEKDDPWRYHVPNRKMLDEMWQECMFRLKDRDIGLEGAAEELKKLEDSVEAGRQGLFGTLVMIVLLNELLRRRRQLFF